MSTGKARSCGWTAASHVASAASPPLAQRPCTVMYIVAGDMPCAKQLLFSAALARYADCRCLTPSTPAVQSCVSLWPGSAHSASSRASTTIATTGQTASCTRCWQQSPAPADQLGRWTHLQCSSHQRTSTSGSSSCQDKPNSGRCRAVQLVQSSMYLGLERPNNSSCSRQHY